MKKLIIKHASVIVILTLQAIALVAYFMLDYYLTT